MQRIKELFTGEDRAVSPVIGVILMVAITVILAAVIATFVIGLGDNTDDVSPNIAFETDYDLNDTSGSGATNTTTISIDTADANVDADNIKVDVNGETLTWGDYAEISAGQDITIGESGASSVDDTVSVSIAEGDEITILFETDDGSDTLDSFTVPSA